MEYIIHLHKAVNYETVNCRVQVHRKKETAKVTKGMSALGFSGGLSTAIMLQRSDPKFIKTISCISDSYHIFVGTTIQLDDVVKMCCDSDNVLCIYTTFNLCSSWVTDCCGLMAALEQMRVSIQYF